VRVLQTECTMTLQGHPR